MVVEQGDALLLLPLVLRPILVAGEPVPGHPDALDGISPYGYPAPLIRAPGAPSSSATFVREALSAASAALAEQHVVCAFVRLHPVLPGADASLLADAGALVQHGRTVWVDLARPEAELERQTRKTYRNLVRRMTREGLTARMVPWADDLERFEAVYSQTMRLVGADPSYDFGTEYLEGFGRALGGRLSLCLVEDGDEIACAGLFTECGSIVQYHLSGTNPSSPRSDAPKLMLHFVRGWAKERGAAIFHLGGGVGAGDDSLFFFKSGFSKLTAPFHSWRVVFDDVVFRDAVRLWEERSGCSAGRSEGFFPPYRKALPTAGAADPAG